MPKGIYSENQSWSKKRRKKLSDSCKGRVPWNKGKSWPQEIKNKISKSKLKKNIKPQSGRSRAKKMYPDVICEICGRKAERHHIDENPVNNVRTNLRFLCRKHHKQIHIIHKKLFNKFNIVFALELFEYVFDPLTALKNIYHCLKKDGVLIISFPFVYPIHNPASEDYLRYTYNGAVRLLDEYGFKILEVHRRIDRTGKLTEFYQADGMHCAGDSNSTGYIIKAQKK